MNRYIWILIVLVILGGGTIAYLKLSPTTQTVDTKCPPTGETKNIVITVKKNTWAFTPDSIEVNCGDSVVLTAVNEDTFDHGIESDELEIKHLMPANSSTVLNFIAQQPGDFSFTCYIPCGSGTVHGERVGHFDMTGTIKVKELVEID